MTVYDATTLAVTDEIVFPTKAAESNTSVGYTALFDGERFLGVTNLFPRASISIIDLEKRRFAGEIDAGGCVGIYPTGERSFASLCASGTALEISFDESGVVTERTETAKFFDSVDDPVMLAGARIVGERWLWVSFEGVAPILHDMVRLCEELGHELVEAAPQIDVEAHSEATLTVWCCHIAHDIGVLSAMTGRPVGPETLEAATLAAYEHGRM